MSAEHPKVQRKKRSRVRRVVLTGGVAVALGVAATGAWALTRPSAGDSYVTGTVTSGEVTQTLTGTGTVASVGDISVSFPAEAEVTSVSKKLGDTVSAGEEIATIDDEELAQAVDEAALDLAEAQQALDEAEDAADEEDSTDSSDSAGSSSAESSSAGSGATGSGSAGSSSTGSSQTSPQDDQADSGSKPETEDSSSVPDAVTAALDEAREAYSTAWEKYTSAVAAATQTCTTAAATDTADGTNATNSSHSSQLSIVPAADTSESASPEATDSPSAEPTASSVPSASPTAEPTATPTETATPEPTSSPTSEPSATPTPTSEPSATQKPSEDPVEDPVDLTPCISALEGLATTEEAAATARTDLDEAIDALVDWADTALAEAASDAAASSPAETGESGAADLPQGTTSDQSSAGSGATDSGSAGSAGTAGSAASGGGATSSGSAGTATGSTGTQSEAAASGASGGGSMGAGESQTVEQAEVALEQAQLDYASAKLALSQATLVAPADGVLTAMPFTEGETASTSDVATVSTDEAVTVPIEVPVTDIADVAVGQEVSLSDATGSSSEGEVVTIALLPTDGATTYRVSVVVADPAEGLAVGTSANLTVTTASSENAVLAPISALALTGDDSATVQVLEDGQSVQREVALGIRGTTHIEITEGLDEGDTLVLADTTQALPTSESSTSSVRGITGGGSAPTMPGGGMQPGTGGTSGGGSGPRG